MVDVVLDRESFRALSSKTRVSILKRLAERRKTASELARDVGITAQAASEHLRKMEKAGLVVAAKRSKWVYFELSEKGRAVLEPGTTKLFVLLAISLVAVGWSAMRIMAQRAVVPTEFPAPVLTDAGERALAATAENAAAQTPVAGFEAFLLVLGAIGIGFAVSSLMRRKS
ncbi:hypothetical protein COT29_00575 [Candidatus Micrarchaeota archaeon CG08_land_8_20_14_0_20_59_11]|nr:MAG: hypothetical protein COT29_00575 [Candidatus Micrarchaeota archaeon CG08_land_8_20_14_0_20_59_11]